MRRILLGTAVAAAMACGTSKPTVMPQYPGLIESAGTNQANAKRFIYHPMNPNDDLMVIATPGMIRARKIGENWREWKNTPEKNFIIGTIVSATESRNKVFLLTAEGWIYYFTRGGSSLYRIRAFEDSGKELAMFPYTGESREYEIALVRGKDVAFIGCSGDNGCVMKVKSEAGAERIVKFVPERN